MAVPLLEWGHFLYSVIGLYQSALFICETACIRVLLLYSVIGLYQSALFIYEMACIRILLFGLFFVAWTHVC